MTGSDASRLHVALIAPYPPDGERHGGHSGVASYTANLADGLMKHDVDVTVLAPRIDHGSTREPKATLRGRGLEVRREYDLGRAALPGAAQSLAALMAQRHVDIVHLQWELFLYGGPPSIPGLVPALASLKRCGAPLVVTMHQVVDPAEVDRHYTRLHRVHAPASVARWGISGVQRALAATAVATIVHEPTFTRVLPGTTVIPHGIEIVNPLDREQARAALGLDDRFTAMCFGFLAPYKGLDIALEAARRAGPAMQLVIAGREHPRMARGSSFGYELRERYADDARFTGWVADDDVARWFAAVDLAIFPYPKPFAASGVLALALAHGTPVLLSPALARCAGAPSVLSAPMHPVALADRFDLLARKPAALDELRRWTEILASGRRWPAVASLHADLYQEVLDVERHPRRRLRAG